MPSWKKKLGRKNKGKLKVYIPNHAVQNFFLMKYAQENDQGQWLGGIFSTVDQFYPVPGNTQLIILSTADHICSQTRLLDRSLDEMTDLIFSQYV